MSDRSDEHALVVAHEYIDIVADQQGRGEMGGVQGTLHRVRRPACLFDHYSVHLDLGNTQRRKIHPWQTTWVGAQGTTPGSDCQKRA